MSERQETVADITAEMAESANKFRVVDSLMLGIYETRIGIAYKRELTHALASMRSKLYGLAADLHGLAARSDARQRGVSYTVIQEMAAKIENIADNGGAE